MSLSLRSSAWAMLVASLWLPWAVLAEEGMFGASPEPAASRVHLRQRTGVHASSYADDMAHEGATNGVSPQELRRLSLRPRGRALVDLSRWPKEPASPQVLSADQLARALSQLCPPTLHPASAQQMATHIIDFAREFAIDPMLLGALIYHQSECDAGRRNAWGVGLTMLNRGLIPTVHDGTLRYQVRDAAGGWATTTLRFVPPFPLGQGALSDPATNLYVAAALLRIARDQCPDVDSAFQSVPHRHHVSHFVWGDRVLGAAPEDSILTARRRLIEYYFGARAQLFARVSGLVLASPLDGAPRIMTSGLGDARDRGRRAHAGIDYVSWFGEPVRAVADGTVTRAGSDRHDGVLLDLAPEHAALVPDAAMGVRGLFIELQHAKGIRSVYAHLASYVVRAGETVKRGQLLGYLGRSGVRHSDTHLHFGLFQKDQVLDPRSALAPLLFAPELERRATHEQPAARGGRARSGRQLRTRQKENPAGPDRARARETGSSAHVP